MSKALRKAIKELMDEVTSSGAAGPYATPYAFVGPKGKKSVAKGVDKDDFEPKPFGKKSPGPVKETKLQELSPKTLGSYVKKASTSYADHATDAEVAGMHDRYTRSQESGKTARKRAKGIRTATDKLVKKATPDHRSESKKGK